jgi:predicted ATPase
LEVYQVLSESTARSRLEAVGRTSLTPLVGREAEVALQFEREELPQQKLRKLEGFVVQYGLPPQATYVFKHALIQEAAYQSLLRSTRQQHHQRIAQVLETRFPGTVDTQPELLAHHYTEAGLSAQAIPYWQRAGQRAIQRSANVEATNHLTKGLEVLKALPYTLELTREELELQTALGLSLIAIKGYGAPEVEEAYIRARQLCQQVGENPPLFPVLRGLWNCYLVRAELQTARDLGKELLSLAKRHSR